MKKTEIGSQDPESTKKPFSWSKLFDSVELGMRLMLAVGFGIAAAISGYGLGAIIWSGIGVILALCFAPFGFVYGFFATEINFCIRMAFKAFRLWVGF